MNQHWHSFLMTQYQMLSCAPSSGLPNQAIKNQNFICAIDDLAVLSIAGIDSSQFLQGQITCNVNDLNENQSSIGAICNPKGRVITTFLLIKSAEGFLMVLPSALLESIKKRLQMYVLRAKVTLTSESDLFCLVGVSTANSKPVENQFTTTQKPYLSVDFPAAVNTSRRLMVLKPDQAIDLWSDYVDRQFVVASPDNWRYQDIVSGIPWLTPNTSEEFIPQMLNLDKLNGISYNKGCYTGQEIVARTHFLGQSKRALYLAECAITEVPEPNSEIIDDSQENKPVVAKVVAAQKQLDNCKMLIVLQNLDSNSKQLKLSTPNRDTITVLTL